MSDSIQNGLMLGYPFDQLFDQQCPLTFRGSVVPGIKLPQNNGPGTGNIVICGAPGSGKSTLALQFAVACATRDENRSVCSYISLENSPSEVLTKAEPFGWDNHFQLVNHLHWADTFSSSDQLGSTLVHILTQPKECAMASGKKRNDDVCRKHENNADKKWWEIDIDSDKQFAQGKILLTSLSPRPLDPRDQTEDFFWKRYHQVENLLSAASSLRKQDKCPETKRVTSEKQLQYLMPIVVIDSLNMFFMRNIEREKVFRLFELFRRYETIGIFTVESTLETPFDSTLADVVISLTSSLDNGYMVRHFEIQKSRYQNCVVGQHPFKPFSIEGKKDLSTPPISMFPPNEEKPKYERGKILKNGIVVFPSLHYIVNKTTRSETDKEFSKKAEQQRWQKNAGEEWGIRDFKRLLPGAQTDSNVFVIEGPRGTFKTNLAMTFLARGLQKGEAGLLIRLHDRPFLKKPDAEEKPTGTDGKDNPIKPDDRSNWPILREDLVELYDEKKSNFRDWHSIKPIKNNKALEWQNLSPVEKAIITVWENENSSVKLFELDFKSGTLLPEEFVQVIQDIIIRQENGKEIRRVVLDDVSEIGASYPMLKKSTTSGELFLTAFAHLLRNYKVDLVITGTTGEFREADEMVGRACTLADTVISCRFSNVFGKRHVTVQSEGLIAQTSGNTVETAGSSAPLVIHNISKEASKRMFRVDSEYLEGLVGFETGNVYRPGVILRLFEENPKIHRDYNQKLRTMLRAAFSASSEETKEVPSGAPNMPSAKTSEEPVSILSFGSDESDIFHHSLEIFNEEAPIDKTVICTVDEFWDTVDYPKKHFIPFSAKELKGDGDNKSIVDITKFMDDKENATVWPYYLNVLLLVYRTDIIKKKVRKKLLSWEYVHDVLKTTKKIIKDTKSPKEPFEINRPFWYDLSAPETLSCMLLDALMAGYLQDKRRNRRDKEKYLKSFLIGRQALTKPQKKEIYMLHKIFHEAGIAELMSKSRQECLQEYKQILPTDAAVYVCWYSQLRELIVRQPALADKFKVCALPGGGFTGDWFVGIMNGSVSPDLGQTVIELICSRQEEYRRLALGIGLPNREGFKDKEFFAWPRGTAEKLKPIYEIREGALSRAKIEHYEIIRPVLYTIARQLTPLSGSSPNDKKELIFEIVNRLFKHVQFLKPKKSDDTPQ